jgi:hypothetical protein
MKGIYAIVGQQFRSEEERQLIRSLKDGAELTLIREPSNKFDPNAVQVWAMNGEKLILQLVGYIKGNQVMKLARFIDANGAPPLLKDEAAIRAGAIKKKIDPDTAVNVARRESGAFSFTAKLKATGDRWPMAEVKE